MSRASGTAHPIPDGYMTVEEFAALTSSQQHAVWKAAGKGVDWVHLNPRDAGSVHLYHREQVRALLAGLAAAGTTVTG